MLIRDRDESFSRWGLSESDRANYIYYEVDYLGSDIVDVELYSALRYLSKHYLPKVGLDLITWQVMNQPGLTWMEATKECVKKELSERQSKAREYSERALMSREDKSFRTNMVQGYCRCGNPAARACMFGECGYCCEGPCDRHGT